MLHLLRLIIITFVPIFVAMDVTGALPVFIGMTSHLSADQRRRFCARAVLTALVVGAAFVLIGHGVFSLLSITAADFKIAGGLLLVAFAVLDLVVPGEQRKHPSREAVTDAAIVPFGVPLIVGPAVLTTTLLLVDEYGIFVTLVGLMLNLLLALVVFSRAILIARLIGRNGMRAISKVIALLLAAIGVMMIRVGITAMIGGVAR